MELITIKTLNTILFPYFLFTLYFCLGCCLIYTLNSPQLTPQPAVDPFTNSHSETLNCLSTLDLDHLPLRECRKAIRLINTHLPKPERIRQKIKGKDAPVAWLRQQIKQYLVKNLQSNNSLQTHLKVK